VCAELVELTRVGPVRGRPASLEQAGRGQHEPARADRAHDLRPRRGRAEVALHGLVAHRGHGPGPSGYDHRVRPWHFGKGAFRGQGEADIRRHRFLALADDHGSIRRGQALQHLQRPDEVEEGDLREDDESDHLLRLAACRWLRPSGGRRQKQECDGRSGRPVHEHLQ
jgi:hypothetical protein